MTELGTVIFFFLLAVAIFLYCNLVKAFFTAANKRRQKKSLHSEVAALRAEVNALREELNYLSE